MYTNKRKNALIWGFNSESAAGIINALKGKNIIDIKVWIGTAPESTHDMITFFIGDFTKETYKGKGYKIYEDIYSITIYRYIDMMSRHAFYSEKSFHSLVNIYNLQYDMFTEFLIRNNINLVLFSNLPHEGPDLLLYEIAKKMNIKTVLFYQSLFPNRFFHIYDLNDFGKFNETKIVSHNPNIKVKRQYEKKLFYMDNVKKHNVNFFSLGRESFLRSLLHYGSFFLKKRNYKNMKEKLNRHFRQHAYQKEMYANINHQVDDSTKIPIDLNGKRSRPLPLFLKLTSASKRFILRYSNYRQAKKNLSNITSREINLEHKFIYFPLHLQPELTTSTLGGIYLDQLLAIERLSKLIPDDWCIYVKENPKQTELMRGKWFYERLNLIKKVKVTPLNYDTYSLIKKCCFVATITGTVGWEAISGGKNALVFGKPWYMTLPGVFLYKDDFKLDDILNYEIKHEELEAELNVLLCKTGEGIIDESYSALVKNFNSNDNTLKVATLIETLLT